MEDEYGMADLRHYISSSSSSSSSSRPLFPVIPPPLDSLSAHRCLGAAAQNPYDVLNFWSESTTTTTAAEGGFGGFEINTGGFSGGGDVGAARWPRQETLMLLEIRSRLDPKFKEANQKGPLWDEVSRIMSEEHGYHRSGKKCREKFENLYKYYKKTKEGKVGRQDGKNYRFFRQLEAIYGETSNFNRTLISAAETQITGGCINYSFPGQEYYPGPKLPDTSLNLSNYSESDNSTSSDDSEGMLNGTDSKKKKKKKREKHRWKVKIKEFFDSQMKKLMEKQEAWMEKMMRTIEKKEQERVLREEEWRKQDVARMEREHKFWARERAWIKARDSSVMEALQNLNGKELTMNEHQQTEDGSDQTMNNPVNGGDIRPESDITRLVQLRTRMEMKFQRGEISEEAMWDNIENGMVCFGNERGSAIVCKEKWDSVNDYLIKCHKKRKEINSKGCSAYYQNQNQNQNQNHEQSISIGVDPTIRLNHHGYGDSSSNNNNDKAISGESCIRYFMGDPFGRILN